MALEVSIIDAVPAHADQLVLRAADRIEVAATTDIPAHEALRDSIIHSPRYCKAGFADGELACVFGVGSGLLSTTGCPWLLGSDRIARHPAAFIRRCKPYLDDMTQGFRYLENWVHADNRVAIRWLRWLGFTLEPPAPWGIKGALFHHFFKEV